MTHNGNLKFSHYQPIEIGKPSNSNLLVIDLNDMVQHIYSNEQLSI